MLKRLIEWLRPDPIIINHEVPVEIIVYRDTCGCGGITDAEYEAAKSRGEKAEFLAYSRFSLRATWRNVRQPISYTRWLENAVFQQRDEINELRREIARNRLER